MIQAATLVALSVPELRRLITLLQKRRPPDIHFHWAWSIWRRRHQARAMIAHHRKRTLYLQL